MSLLTQCFSHPLFLFTIFHFLITLSLSVPLPLSLSLSYLFPFQMLNCFFAFQLISSAYLRCPAMGFLHICLCQLLKLCFLKKPKFHVSSAVNASDKNSSWHLQSITPFTRRKQITLIKLNDSIIWQAPNTSIIRDMKSQRQGTFLRSHSQVGDNQWILSPFLWDGHHLLEVRLFTT